ncbi:hypothetical protein D018_0929, partial [Vibrio parahaemolyticus VP2007-007]
CSTYSCSTPDSSSCRVMW